MNNNAVCIYQGIIYQGILTLRSQRYLMVKQACLLLLTIFLLASTTMANAQITQLSASVDRNTLLLDESINLTLVATGSADRDDADFSPLSQNFRVGRPSFSMSTQIINGSMTRNVSWTVQLFPKQTGRFEIPSLEIDGQRSEPFFVDVLEVGDPSDSQPRDFYVSAEINQDNIYLQQQLLYTLKIHLSREIQRGNLNLPELEGALIEQIGEDRDYQDIIDGVRYRIIERKYAIIPQSSGDFVIGGPIFDAEVLTNSRQSFANFGRTRSISRRAPDLNIKVAPIPAGYSYTWLPSEFVEVNEEWQGDLDNLVVGEPITRTITLTASGLTKEQLPEIKTLYHPDFKIYPEQPSLATAETAQALVSQSTLNTAIIPGKSGNYVLPEVRVPWFNVNTGQTEFALIPARSVEVKDKAPNSLPITQTEAEVPNIEQLEPMQSASQGLMSENNRWLIYALIASNILTLILLIMVWSSRKTLVVAPSSAQSASDTPKNPYAASEAVLFNQLKAQLEQGKIENISKQLDAWLKASLGTQHHSVSLSLLKHGRNNHTPGQNQDENQLLAFYNLVLSIQANGADANAESIDFMAIVSALKDLRESILSQQSQSALTKLYPK